MAHLTNINRSKGQPAARPEDYLIQWDQGVPRQQDPVTMRANFYRSTRR